MTTESTNDALIGSREAKAISGGISDMTLWRWIRAGIVPQPLVIRNRKYWPRGEFIASLRKAGRAA